MYLTILLLPLLNAIIAGLLGRKIGKEGSHIITITGMIICLILGLIGFYEIGYNQSWVNIKLGSYIKNETININWSFTLDSLSITMLVMVLMISTCVHIYSVGYMWQDAHNQRFMSYLSLFTFFMLILITGDNFIVIFIGWEGSYKLCPILCYIYLPNKRHFHTKKIRSTARIGPHEEKTILILIAFLLGDGYLSKGTLGSRFQFEQCSNNIEYLMWFHKYFSIKGYCSTKKPKLLKRIHKNGKIHYSYQFKTYTFSSFNWIHDMFYDKNNKKILPKNIEQYLTPLVLAIWFMDDGSIASKNNGLKISAQSFTLQELELLCIILYKNFGIVSKPQFRGIKYNNYVIYICEESCYNFSYIIKPYMLQSMYYKLGKYI